MSYSDSMTIEARPLVASYFKVDFTVAILSSVLRRVHPSSYMDLVAIGPL